ncbi:MAG: hypothetical protein JJT85_04595 [Chromatiales bacterium]|nr:hypothetical protein [Chromatiales bacterium]
MTQIRFIRIQGRRPGILAQIFGLLIGAAVLVVSLVLGAFLLAALLGLFVLSALVLVARAWWLRRQFERALRQAGGQRPGEPGAGGDVIEGEYRVVDRDRRGRSDLD